MTSIKATINRIIPFSSVDGPGNRTAIFFQGCNINCAYCHNPETINECIHCGECVGVCPTDALRIDGNNKVTWDEKKCIECDQCIKVCRFSSSPKTKDFTPDELKKVIEKYKGFIQGITVSGGESTLRIEFLRELFKRTKELGLTNFVDTNGSVPLWDKREFVEVTDKFMIDLKAGNSLEYKKLTGHENSAVVKNIEHLGKLGKIFEIRTVVVPGILVNEEIVRLGAKLINEIDSNIRYKLIKFRNHGVREDMKKIQSPSEEYMEQLKKIAINEGCKNVIIL